MAYSAADGRTQLLDTLADATDELALALAALGEAYEQVDEHTGDVLEERLFRPVQLAYGRASRAHGQFAARHGLDGRAFEPRKAGLPSLGAKGFVESAVEAIREADGTLSTLQDSLLPVEVGDPQIRAELADLREIMGDLPHRARELLRTFGR
ncbi:MAG TPA: hypothetical protein VMY78_12190 [Solirubrobacteraceae bacterium]|nr:hypothetical protein [Solirubrobacteraceae bacterium]